MCDQARLDGLAEANVVGDQQIDTRHLDGTEDGVELVVFDVDARAEWGLDVSNVGGEVRSPSDGIKEGIKSIGSVEAGSIWGRATFSTTVCPRFDSR